MYSVGCSPANGTHSLMCQPCVLAPLPAPRFGNGLQGRTPLGSDTLLLLHAIQRFSMVQGVCTSRQGVQRCIHQKCEPPAGARSTDTAPLFSAGGTGDVSQLPRSAGQQSLHSTLSHTCIHRLTPPKHQKECQTAPASQRSSASCPPACLCAAPPGGGGGGCARGWHPRPQQPNARPYWQYRYAWGLSSRSKPATGGGAQRAQRADGAGPAACRHGRRHARSAQSVGAQTWSPRACLGWV